MAATLKTSRDMFYFVEDIMRLLGYSRSKSYKVIASLNRELEAKGKCTCEGRVIKRYFNERYGLEEPETAARKRAQEDIMERKRKRTRAYVRSYYRMALLALAAMVTARLVLLMIDMIQLQIENAGAFCIPAYAFILVFCGWELKTWTTQGKERTKCTTTSATTAEQPLTRAKSATAGGKRLEQRSARS